MPAPHGLEHSERCVTFQLSDRADTAVSHSQYHPPAVRQSGHGRQSQSVSPSSCQTERTRPSVIVSVTLQLSDRADTAVSHSQCHPPAVRQSGHGRQSQSVSPSSCQTERTRPSVTVSVTLQLSDRADTAVSHSQCHPPAVRQSGHGRQSQSVSPSSCQTERTRPSVTVSVTLQLSDRADTAVSHSQCHPPAVRQSGHGRQSQSVSPSSCQTERTRPSVTVSVTLQLSDRADTAVSHSQCHPPAVRQSGHATCTMDFKPSVSVLFGHYSLSW